MSDIRVRAHISLLTVQESGRTAPVKGSYRPNHNFGGPENRQMDIGFIEFSEGELLYPGGSMEREIVFWSRPGLEEALVRGREWRIQEGPKFVGVGTVLEILSSP